MSTDETGICFVRNLAQKVLMDFELKGQMSDGHWENSRQDWKVWCNVEFVVSPDGKLGTRNVSEWEKQRARYNLSAKTLLDIVGYRMMASVRVCERFPELARREIRHAVECIAELALTSDPLQHDFQKDYLAAVVGVVGEENMAEFNRVATDVSLYTMKQMRKDLNDLKEIMKLSLDNC